MEQQITAMFDRYVTSFSSWKTEAICGHWCVPATISVGDQITTFATIAELGNNIDVLCSFYRDQGVDRADAKVLICRLLLANAAQVSVRYTVTCPDNAIICEWTHHYIIRCVDNDWKIAFAIADDEIKAWAARGTPLG
jgi:hypothetical protein